MIANQNKKIGDGLFFTMDIYSGGLKHWLGNSLNVGDLVQLKKDHPYEERIGVIVERTIEILPPGTNKILVYKVLSDGIIINVPYKWLQIINTHPSSQEK